MCTQFLRRRRQAIVVAITVANPWIVAFAQEAPTSDGQTLLPLDAPALIPEKLLDPLSVPLEPAPILEQPTNFPQESAGTEVRSAELVPRRPPELSAPSDTIFEDVSSGAASFFGSENGIGSNTRPSIAGAQAERERQRILARAERRGNLEHYNFKLGPIPFRFGAGVEFQFSDNANLSRNDKIADLSIVPHIDMYGGIMLSRWNTLSIQLGMGYIWNLNRPELDRALTNASVGLDSDSGISFDIKVGNFRINFYDRPAIPRQQFDLITQRNALQYAQFTNTAGVTVFWDVNSRLFASLQYDHLNVISLKSDVENLDQSSDSLGASVTYAFSSGLSIGAQANGSKIKYDQQFLNDSTSYSAGLTLTARTSRSTTLNVVAGYQVGQFASGATVSDESGLGDWYMRISVTHNINRFLSQTIAAGHESQIGTASNSTEIDYLRHQFNMSIARTFGLGTVASFDSATESGGVFAQEFKLLQLGLYGYWTFSKKASLTFSYRFTKRETAEESTNRDDALGYVENRFDLGIQLSL